MLSRIHPLFTTIAVVFILLFIQNAALSAKYGENDLRQIYQKKSEELVRLGWVEADKKNVNNAEKLFLSAIKTYNRGWTWTELAKFYDFSGQYEKLLKVTNQKIRKDFPLFVGEIAAIHNKAIEILGDEKTKDIPLLQIKINPAPKKTSTYSKTSTGRTENRSNRAENHFSHSAMSKDTISQNCKRKWGTNYSMVEYCIKEQSEAKRAIAGKKKDEIYRNCSGKWGTNYEMVEYCIREQSEAKRAIAGKKKDEIYRDCSGKWGTNYEMVEYCIKEQSEARRRVEGY